jgi:lipid-A-disaccharide synthase
LLKQASVAIVTSGTATLETAMFNVPQVVCYRTSEITYAIARSFIKVKFISLVNLIANKAIVKELIQDEFNPTNLSAELKLLLNNPEHRNAVLNGYSEIQKVLGTERASDKTAKLIVEYLKA